MEHSGAPAIPLWTGGVVSHILEASFMIWHGSQQRITFLNNLNSSDADDRPKGKDFAYCHSVCAIFTKSGGASYTVYSQTQGALIVQFNHKLW